MTYQTTLSFHMNEMQNSWKQSKNLPFTLEKVQG